MWKIICFLFKMVQKFTNKSILFIYETSTRATRLSRYAPTFDCTLIY